MASVNKVIIVGNLGRDPEIRYMPSGDAIANIAVAILQIEGPQYRRAKGRDGVATMRTARSITSGEYLIDFFMVAPFSQMLEPPSNPGRFSVLRGPVAKATPTVSASCQTAFCWSMLVLPRYTMYFLECFAKVRCQIIFRCER
jgi:hypothetical protein